MTKSAIVLTPAGGLASAEIDPRAGNLVVLGQRLVATAELDFGPYGIVVFGDTGLVTYVNQVSGEVQVTVSRYIPDMAPWENTFTLMPFESDETISALSLLVCAPAKGQWRAAAGLAIMLTLACAAPTLAGMAQPVMTEIANIFYGE